MQTIVDDFGEAAERLWGETSGDVVFRRELPGVVEAFVLNEWYFGSLVECIEPTGPEWTGLALQYHAHSLGPDSAAWAPPSARALLEELERVDRTKLRGEDGEDGYGAYVERVLDRLLAFLKEADTRGMTALVGGRDRM